MKPVRVHPEARGEERHALLWYFNESEDAAIRFSTELRAAYRTIQNQPHTYSKYLHDTRRKILNHFPYFIVFRELSDVIEIIALAHAKRRPGYWKERLKSH